MVYDLVNHQITIAATDFNATGSNIVPPSSLSAHIPGATAARSQNQATAAASVATPAYDALDGFKDSATGTAGGENEDNESENAGTRPEPFDLARFVFLGVTMSFVMAGSGFFMLF